MYKFHHGLMLLVLLMYAFTVKSEEVGQAKNLRSQIRNSWTLSLEHYKESYKETISQKTLMREDASMLGLKLVNQHYFSEPFFMRSSVRFALGESDYTGAVQHQEYGSFKSKGQLRTTLDFQLTGHYTTSTRMLLTPYSGIGYRYLVDHLQEVSGGYKREANYAYGILGISSYFMIADKVQLAPYFQYHYLLFGKQFSYIDGEDSSPLVHKQRQGYGYEIGLPVALSSNDRWQLTAFYRYWHIADSNKVVNSHQILTMEPDNKTKEFGVKIDYRF